MRVRWTWTADDALGLAAQLAYYFFLALFPAILALLALASFFPIHDFTDQMTASMGRFAPPEMLDLIRGLIGSLSGSADAGILSVGFLGALWSSSAALGSLIGALNRACDIEESRPWWTVRLTGDSADHRARPVHRDIGSLAFRFYVVNFSSYQQTYGLVGSVIVLMLWFYLSGICLIVGAEMAAEIEHASPWGKDPGERVPGQRKKIGLAARAPTEIGSGSARLRAAC